MTEILPSPLALCNEVGEEKLRMKKWGNTKD